MDTNQLVKEVITTTTERYGDNGNVKEKITETREKVYSTFYSEEDIEKAKPVEEKKGENASPSAPKAEPEKLTKEAEVKAAADAIERAKTTTQNPLEGLPKPNGQENPYEAWQQQQQATNAIAGMATPQPPQYNVANRVPTTKFPWEK